MEKIDELTNQLFIEWKKLKDQEKLVKTLKEPIQKYFEKTGIDKYTSEEFILSLETRTEYKIPTPTELRTNMGDTFADAYIEEVVNKDVRFDLPPAIQNKLMPITKETTYIAVKKRDKLQEEDYNRYAQKEKV